MQCEVGQLMPKRDQRITCLTRRTRALHNDSSLGGKRERASPVRRLRSGIFPESARVAGDDNEDALAGPRKPRKGVIRDGAQKQRVRQHGVLRLGYESKTTAFLTVATVLPSERGRPKAERVQDERGGDPPASTCCSIPEQRFPHGLNLFACAPSRHASRAPAVLPPNHRARPSS